MKPSRRNSTPKKDTKTKPDRTKISRPKPGLSAKLKQGESAPKSESIRKKAQQIDQIDQTDQTRRSNPDQAAQVDLGSFSSKLSQVSASRSNSRSESPGKFHNREISEKFARLRNEGRRKQESGSEETSTHRRPGRAALLGAEEEQSESHKQEKFPPQNENDSSQQSRSQKEAEALQYQYDRRERKGKHHKREKKKGSRDQKHGVRRDDRSGSFQKSGQPQRPENQGRHHQAEYPQGERGRGHVHGQQVRSKEDRGRPESGRYESRSNRFDRRDRGSQSERPKNTRNKNERHEKNRGDSPWNTSGKKEKLTAKATVEKNQKGFAFLIFENKKIEDAFVPPREAEALFHGDRVEVVLSSSGRPKHIHVLGHRFREVVGRFTPQPTGKIRTGWVVYEKKRAREEIFIPQMTQEIAAGDWVRAKLHFHESGPYRVTGEILDVYGKSLPASADVSMIAAEYSLEEEHSLAAENEAKIQKLEVPGKDLEGRQDLRNMPFITIDGETARDFDDAIFVERTKAGFILWVAIADVSHYVKQGSALDTDARSRGTSVYFPERAFHMLPRALSENLCSLKPKEPRLAMVAKMEFDQNGHRFQTDVMEAVIESKRRATYNEIQKEWDLHGKDKNWEYAPHFSLYEALRQMRVERGSIDFELPEAELIVEPGGEVIEIRHRARLASHRLIEEFMIAANESVTEWMMEKKWPFVYRVHDEPSLQSLERFQMLAATVGVKLSLERAASPKVMSELVRRLEGHPAQSLLNMALLRSMKQAVYTSTHGIHFGLASKAYSHFTSPIRRYPDLVVHRLLRMAIQISKQNETLKTGQREKLEKELEEICEHCSYRERLASDAERDAIKLKQVRVILKHLGEEFDAKIVGMTMTGFFVQISDPYVEGMVLGESISDDFYEFDEDRMMFIGRRKKRQFKVGDAVRVLAARADVERRQIDFTLAVAPNASNNQQNNQPKQKRNNRRDQLE